MKGIIAIVLITLMATGCASSPGVTTNSSSQALELARAAGMAKGLRDVPPETIAQYKKPRGDSEIPGAVLAAGTISGSIATPPGISSGLGSTLLVLDLLGTNKPPAAFNRILYWAPAAEGQVNAQEMLLDAMIKAIPSEFTVTTVEHKNRLGSRTLQSPGIHDRDGNLLFVLLTQEFSNRKETAPKSIGAYPSTTRRKSYISSDDFLLIGLDDGQYYYGIDKIMPHFDLYSYYIKISQNLPSWMYLYLTPRKGVISHPVILNQGNPLYFEKPSL